MKKKPEPSNLPTLNPGDHRIEFRDRESDKYGRRSMTLFWWGYNPWRDAYGTRAQNFHTIPGELVHQIMEPPLPESGVFFK